MRSSRSRKLSRSLESSCCPTSRSSTARPSCTCCSRCVRPALPHPSTRYLIIGRIGMDATPAQYLYNRGRPHMPLPFGRCASFKGRFLSPPCQTLTGRFASTAPHLAQWRWTPPQCLNAIRSGQGSSFCVPQSTQQEPSLSDVGASHEVALAPSIALPPRLRLDAIRPGSCRSSANPKAVCCEAQCAT